MGEELRKLWSTEDYWAVWLGLGIVLMALVVFFSGGTVKGWAVTPGSWSTLGELGSDLAGSGGGYLAIFLLFGAVFTLSMAIMGRRVARFVPGFVILFAGSLAVFYLAGWRVIKELNLGAPFLALLLGLIVGNLVRLPDWFKSSLLVEPERPAPLPGPVLSVLRSRNAPGPARSPFLPAFDANYSQSTT